MDSAVNGGGQYQLLWWFVSSLLFITFVFTLVSFLFIYLNWREGHERLHKGVRDGMVFFMFLQCLNLAIMWPYMDSIANDDSHITDRINDLAVMNGCSDEWVHVDNAALSAQWGYARDLVRNAMPLFITTCIYFVSFAFIEISFRICLKRAQDAYRP